MAQAEYTSPPPSAPSPPPPPPEVPKSVVLSEENHPPTHPEPEDASKKPELLELSTGLPAGAKDRDEALAKVNQDRTLSHIRAWEENQKSKAGNKYNKIISKINAWENTKKAAAEAKLKAKEEYLAQKKAAYIEEMNNTLAEVHRVAEEKRAVAEGKKGEEFLKAEESAARFRAIGKSPSKLWCFGA